MRAWVCWCGSSRQRVVGIGLNSFGGDGRIVIGGADNQARRRGSPTRRTRTSRRDAQLQIDNIKGKVPEYGFRFRMKRKSEFKCPGRPLFLFKLVSGKLVLCGGGGFYQCYYEPWQPASFDKTVCMCVQCWSVYPCQYFMTHASSARAEECPLVRGWIMDKFIH